MQCLQEYQATDFHKVGNQYLLITKDRECLRLDREQRVLERKQMASDELFNTDFRGPFNRHSDITFEGSFELKFNFAFSLGRETIW